MSNSVSAGRSEALASSPFPGCLALSEVPILAALQACTKGKFLFEAKPGGECYSH